MSVNIFGSGSGKLFQKPIQGPPGVGFKLLDKEGNYDIQFKRLANVAESECSTDAVTKGEIQPALEKQMKCFRI